METVFCKAFLLSFFITKLECRTETQCYALWANKIPHKTFACMWSLVVWSSMHRYHVIPYKNSNKIDKTTQTYTIYGIWRFIPSLTLTNQPRSFQLKANQQFNIYKYQQYYPILSLGNYFEIQCMAIAAYVWMNRECKNVRGLWLNLNAAVNSMFLFNGIFNVMNIKVNRLLLMAVAICMWYVDVGCVGNTVDLKSNGDQ